MTAGIIRDREPVERLAGAMLVVEHPKLALLVLRAQLPEEDEVFNLFSFKNFSAFFASLR
jgi:hypothetical protein